MTSATTRAVARVKEGVGRPRSRAERSAAGKAPSNRRDAVELVLAAEKGRVPDLLPLRHGRMVRSAFAFYRGAALTMAADLAATPTTGIRVQCCGDGHLCNFGGFATPERRVIFSINDLDETLPGPWEWDPRRLAASAGLPSRPRKRGMKRIHKERAKSRALALSHARSGSASMLSGYMGKSDTLDEAIASLSLAYADQNEKDHAALDRAVRSGSVKAVFEEAK
jgi:hypothetical protein